MSKFFTRIIFTIAIGLFALLQACNNRSSTPAPTTGTLSISITTGSPATALSDVRVLVFNAATNEPAAAGSSGSDGKYSVSLNPGSYFVKLGKQSYIPVPASALLNPVPQKINAGATNNYPVNMTASSLTAGGWVSGKVPSGIANVLVAVEATGVAYTSISDSSGNYIIYNVPPAAYTVKGYAQSHTIASKATTVTANAGSTVDLIAGTAPTNTVPVRFKLIAGGGVSSPATMVVSLVHPITKEAIPGLSLSQAYPPPLNYSFSGVADGRYIVRATFANDTIVVDPDNIVKAGEPSVTVSSGTPTPTVEIIATLAVTLTSPTNALNSTDPVPVTGLTPTFSWEAYSSTSDYVIEVMDANSGSIVWGGFTGMGTATATKNIMTTLPTINYNSDGKATALVVGKTYRWRIYASKDDKGLTPPWKLISMSEDQMGLFTVK